MHQCVVDIEPIHIVPSRPLPAVPKHPGVRLGDDDRLDQDTNLCGRRHKSGWSVGRPIEYIVYLQTLCRHGWTRAGGSKIVVVPHLSFSECGYEVRQNGDVRVRRVAREKTGTAELQLSIIFSSLC